MFELGFNDFKISLDPKIFQCLNLNCLELRFEQLKIFSAPKMLKTKNLNSCGCPFK